MNQETFIEDLEMALENARAELFRSQETPGPTYDDIKQRFQHDPFIHPGIQKLSVNQSTPGNEEAPTSSKKPTIATLNLAVQEWKDKTTNDTKIMQNLMQELLQKQQAMEQWLRRKDEIDQSQIQLKFRIKYLERRIGELKIQTPKGPELSRSNVTDFGHLPTGLTADTEPYSHQRELLRHRTLSFENLHVQHTPSTSFQPRHTFGRQSGNNVFLSLRNEHGQFNDPTKSLNPFEHNSRAPSPKNNSEPPRDIESESDEDDEIAEFYVNIFSQGTLPDYYGTESIDLADWLEDFENCWRVSKDCKTTDDNLREKYKIAWLL